MPDEDNLLGSWPNEVRRSHAIRYDLTNAFGPSWALADFLQASELEDVLATELVYSPAAGEPRLRAAIGRFLKVEPQRVIVTNGASEAIQLVLLEVCHRGGKILVPTPGYQAFGSMARAFGLEVSRYPICRETGFAMRCDTVLACVDAATRTVIVNSPHNPTGAVMPQEEIRALSHALEERDVRLLIDEVYWPLSTIPKSHANFIGNAFVVGDLSKAFSLPGLRIGWMIASDESVIARAAQRRSWLSVGSSPVLERSPYPFWRSRRPSSTERGRQF